MNENLQKTGIPELCRVRICEVKPEIEAGRFPIKRVIGETVIVEADLIADGHDELAAVLMFRHLGEGEWTEVPLVPLGNDRWQGSFEVTRVGQYTYDLCAWVDAFATWQHGLGKKIEDGQDVALELKEGGELVAAAAQRATGKDAARLGEIAELLGDTRHSQAKRCIRARGKELTRLMHKYPDRSRASTSGRDLRVVVDRQRARFSTWYEMFPRSSAQVPGQHGSFADCERWLPYVAAMGFDVLYLSPIHPIGTTHRKGKNNSETCAPGDPGSPWAIGSPAGGHKSIHPQLGTLEDFRRLVKAARGHGLEMALDIAFQCSPDHPYVTEHPEWFKWRPDGTVQFAENPPKKYQDIYPFDFGTDAWRELWAELKSIFQFWIEQGISIFRVDNPHTKPFPFWQHVLGELKAEHPELIFLAEAFTRPKIMYGLAKLGFTQSYTYFTWRNSKNELIDYFHELSQTEVREYFRANLWPNTPDILHATLQEGGRPAFMIRYVLAATLGANMGIYGPVYELCENQPRAPGIEEGIDNEKYEIRVWDVDQPHSLAGFIGTVNATRHAHRALQLDWNLHFHPIDNDQLLFYSKHTDNRDDIILVAVNLDPRGEQSGWVHLDLEVLGIGGDELYQVHDQLTGATYSWRGAHNFIRLDPNEQVAHILAVVRGEAPPDTRY